MTRLQLLGRVELLLGDRAIDLGPAKQRAVLAALAVDADHPVATRDLVCRVWDDAPPASARSALYSYITRLRQALATTEGQDSTRLSYRSGAYVLEIDPDVVDLHRFRSVVETAKVSPDDSERAALLHQALDLWHGEPLADLSSEWAERLRNALLHEHVEALVLWSSTQHRLGNAGASIGRLREALERHPLVEPLAAHLIESLRTVGRDAEALDFYATTRRRLIDDLGTEPGPHLQDLHRQMLRGATAGTGPADGAGRPRGADGVARPAQRMVPHILPPDTAAFAGRCAELATVRDALVRAGRTGPGIVAVTGPGGIGKTALAVHAAHALREHFPDGDLFVNLRGVDSGAALKPKTVLARFLRALGVDGAGLPDALDERQDLYRHLLAGRRVIIVLDNAENDDQVAALIPATPSNGVIITSRRRLGAAVGARALPLDVLEPEVATTLLAGIVGAERLEAEPFAATALGELCGWLPLALRIAGSTLASKPHWSLERLITLLHDEHRRLDVFTHGRLDVRSSVSLSYTELTGQARRLLRRLADMAPAEFSSWMAAALLDVAEPVAEETLEQLIDAHLVDVAGRGFQGHTRHRLHDLVRIFGRERLVEEEPPEQISAARTRASGAWLTLLEAAHRSIHGDYREAARGGAPRYPVDDTLLKSVEGAPLAWWATEVPAIVGAVGRAAAENQAEMCWELASTASVMFEMHREFDAWQDMLDIGLSVTRDGADQRGYGAILIHRAILFASRTRYDQAYDLFSQAVQMYSQVDGYGHAIALSWVSAIERRQGHWRLGLRHARSARTALRAAGDVGREAVTEREIAMFYLQQRPGHPQARRHLDRSLELSRRANDRRSAAITEFWRGMLHLQQQKMDDAEDSLRGALAMTRDIDDRIGQAQCLRGLAMCARRRGDRHQARATLAEVLDMVQQPMPTLLENLVLAEIDALDAES